MSIGPPGFYWYLFQSHLRTSANSNGKLFFKMLFRKGRGSPPSSLEQSKLEVWAPSSNHYLWEASSQYHSTTTSKMPQKISTYFNVFISFIYQPFIHLIADAQGIMFNTEISYYLELSSSKHLAYKKVRDNGLIIVFKAYSEITVVLKWDSYLAYRVVRSIQNNCFCFGIKFICKFSRIEDPISTRCSISIIFLKRKTHNKCMLYLNTTRYSLNGDAKHHPPTLS